MKTKCTFDVDPTTKQPPTRSPVPSPRKRRILKPASVYPQKPKVQHDIMGLPITNHKGTPRTEQKVFVKPESQRKTTVIEYIPSLTFQNHKNISKGKPMPKTTFHAPNWNHEILQTQPENASGYLRSYMNDWLVQYQNVSASFQSPVVAGEMGLAQVRQLSSGLPNPNEFRSAFAAMLLDQLLVKTMGQPSTSFGPDPSTRIEHLVIQVLAYMYPHSKGHHSPKSDRFFQLTPYFTRVKMTEELVVERIQEVRTVASRKEHMQTALHHLQNQIEGHIRSSIQGRLALILRLWFQELVVNRRMRRRKLDWFRLCITPETSQVKKIFCGWTRYTHCSKEEVFSRRCNEMSRCLDEEEKRTHETNEELLEMRRRAQEWRMKAETEAELTDRLSAQVKKVQKYLKNTSAHVHRLKREIQTRVELISFLAIPILEACIRRQCSVGYGQHKSFSRLVAQLKSATKHRPKEDQECDQEPTKLPPLANNDVLITFLHFWNPALDEKQQRVTWLHDTEFQKCCLALHDHLRHPENGFFFPRDKNDSPRPDPLNDNILNVLTQMQERLYGSSRGMWKESTKFPFSENLTDSNPHTTSSNPENTTSSLLASRPWSLWTELTLRPKRSVNQLRQSDLAKELLVIKTVQLYDDLHFRPGAVSPFAPSLALHHASFPGQISVAEERQPENQSALTLLRIINSWRLLIDGLMELQLVEVSRGFPTPGSLYRDGKAPRRTADDAVVVNVSGKNLLELQQPSLNHQLSLSNKSLLMTGASSPSAALNRWTKIRTLSTNTSQSTLLRPEGELIVPISSHLSNGFVSEFTSVVQSLCDSLQGMALEQDMEPVVAPLRRHGWFQMASFANIKREAEKSFSMTDTRLSVYQVFRVSDFEDCFCSTEVDSTEQGLQIATLLQDYDVYIHRLYPPFDPEVHVDFVIMTLEDCWNVYKSLRLPSSTSLLPSLSRGCDTLITVQDFTHFLLNLATEQFPHSDSRLSQSLTTLLEQHVQHVQSNGSRNLLGHEMTSKHMKRVLAEGAGTLQHIFGMYAHPHDALTSNQWQVLMTELKIFTSTSRFDEEDADNVFRQVQNCSGSDEDLSMDYLEFCEAMAAIAVFKYPCPFTPVYAKTRMFINVHLKGRHHHHTPSSVESG